MESIALHQAADKTDHFEDRELARRCARGDERALRLLYEAHEPRLRGLIFRNLGSREDAEEVVATTFLRFWKSAGRYRAESSLKSYLTRIALNLCRDAARKRPVLSGEVLPPTAAGEVLPPTAAGDPMADRIREGLLRLEIQDRELLSLYYLEEWDYEEICASLGITYDVLRTRLVRARKRLRSIVEGRDD